MGLREAEIEVGQRQARDGKPKKTRWRGEGAGVVRKARLSGTQLGKERLGPPLRQAAGTRELSVQHRPGGDWRALSCLPCGAGGHPGETAWYTAPPVSSRPLLCLRHLLCVCPLGTGVGVSLSQGLSCPHIYCTDFNQCLCPWAGLSVC